MAALIPLTPELLSLAIKDDPSAPIRYIVAMAALGAGLGVFVELRGRRAGIAQQA